MWLELGEKDDFIGGIRVEVIKRVGINSVMFSHS